MLIENSGKFSTVVEKNGKKIQLQQKLIKKPSLSPSQAFLSHIKGLLFMTVTSELTVQALTFQPLSLELQKQLQPL